MATMTIMVLNPLLRYKARGTIATDLNGTRDTVEFLNIAQDDAITWPHPTYRTYPSTVNARMDRVVTPFVRKSVEVNNTLIAIFERILGLPQGAIAQLHAMGAPSGSEARVVKTPPNQSTAGIGAHTDFGTLVRLPLSPIGGFTSFALSLTVFGRPSSITAWAVCKCSRPAPRSGSMSK